MFSLVSPITKTLGIPSVIVNTCGGTVTAVAASGSISLTGGAIAAALNCSITVNVTGTSVGPKVNVTDLISSLEGGTNGVATASITVGGNFREASKYHREAIEKFTAKRGTESPNSPGHNIAQPNVYFDPLGIPRLNRCGPACPGCVIEEEPRSAAWSRAGLGLFSVR